MNIYFVSDIHVGHFKICEYAKRPFKSVDEMNEKIIQNINAKVREDDRLLLLGDNFFHMEPADCRAFLNRLRCRHVSTLRGNHDNKNIANMGVGFQWSCDEMIMEIAGERVTISHFPFKFKWYVKLWRKITKKNIKSEDRFIKKRPIDRGQYLLHGHGHDKVQMRGREINLCCEAHAYGPVPLQKIADLINQHRQLIEKRWYNRAISRIRLVSSKFSGFVKRAYSALLNFKSRICSTTSA